MEEAYIQECTSVGFVTKKTLDGLIKTPAFSIFKINNQWYLNRLKRFI